MHHRSHQLSKFNRSQASLISDVSAAPSTDNSRVDRAQKVTSSSPQPSPIDSPVYSPSFPPNSASASPLGPEDNKSPFIDYNTAREELVDQRVEEAQKVRPNKLVRRASRVHPTSSAVGSQSGSSTKPPPSANNSDNTDSRSTSIDPRKETTVPEQKKKRHFFGFGHQSKDKTPSSPKGLVRSNSTRSAQSSPLAAPTPISTASGHIISHPRWPGSPNLPSPQEENEPREYTARARDEFVSRKIYNRHSVAFPDPTVPEELRYNVGSGAIDLNNPSTTKNEETAGNTASNQQPVSGQGGAQRTSFRDRIGHRPHHNRAASSGRHASKTELSLPEPKPDSRPSSRQSTDQPSPAQSQLAFHNKSPSVQSAVSINEASMGPPQGQHGGGRNTDTSLASAQAGSREGQYGSTLSVNNQRASESYRTPQASPMVQQTSNSDQQGRNTPPPARSRDDLTQLDVQSLMSKHEELNDKYRKVKKYYFDKDAQVQQLQNTLAHQRLAQSRTSLDDNEYATRFSRLDGAINNLAFNIRKDWKAVPRWLAPYVNQDATTTVTKEMTAVGRACISRWIVDEIFDRYFHPAIEPNLSSNLKVIERNLRRFAPPTQTDEEREALLSKISNWRLSTLDGLQDQLNMHDAAEYRTSLTKILVEMLTTDLTANLKEPTPAGLEAGVVGIIELAVGISANMPLESRDVYVDYVMPGTVVNDSYMKVEGALPPLTNPGESHDQDKSSLNSADAEDEDIGKDQGRKKPGIIGSIMSGNKKPHGAAGGRSQESVEQPKETKVRFAAFMSVEVRGKNMLIKAPVYV